MDLVVEMPSTNYILHPLNSQLDFTKINHYVGVRISYIYHFLILAKLFSRRVLPSIIMILICVHCSKTVPFIDIHCSDTRRTDGTWNEFKIQKTTFKAIFNHEHGAVAIDRAADVNFFSPSTLFFNGIVHHIRIINSSVLKWRKCFYLALRQWLAWICSSYFLSRIKSSVLHFNRCSSFMVAWRGSVWTSSSFSSLAARLR